MDEGTEGGEEEMKGKYSGSFIYRIRILRTFTKHTLRETSEIVLSKGLKRLQQQRK